MTTPVVRELKRLSPHGMRAFVGDGAGTPSSDGDPSADHGRCARQPGDAPMTQSRGLGGGRDPIVSTEIAMFARRNV
jgi:hypothetical protein